jgi:hypothetical protein
LLDSAVAGTTTLSSDADVTLTTTQEAANQAREAILLWTASGTVTRYITAPAQSKSYIVINSSSTQSIVLRGVGPTTGVTIVAGEKAVCAWNGSDFVRVGASGGPGTFSSITNTGLTSGRVVYSTTGGLEIDSANLTFNGTTLTANTLNLTSALGVAYGGTGLSSTPANGALDIGNGTGFTRTTLTAGSNVTITNSAGGITIAAAGVTPAGSNTQVQYNNSGAFGASANLTFDGSQLTINGITAGRGAASVSSNTVFGASSLSVNTTGSTNSVFGQSSLFRNTSGVSNSAFGSTVLQENTTGNSNNAFGCLALLNNTTGSNNHAFGNLALYSNTTGSNNNAFGDTALLSSTGSNNTAIGALSGKDITTGSYNTIVGSFHGNSGGLDITAANNYVVLSDGSGNLRATYNGTGVGFYAQGAITSKSTTATLTGAEVLTQILNTTGSSYTVTMPTGSALDTATGGMPTDTAFNFTVINTASGTITMAVNTGITNVGTLTVLTGISAQFTIRKTAASTFVMYRT